MAYSSDQNEAMPYGMVICDCLMDIKNYADAVGY